MRTVKDYMKYIMLATGLTFYLLAANLANSEEVKTSSQVSSIEVPVLISPIKKGQIITEDMIEIKNVQKRRLPRTTIMSAEEIYYKEAVASIRRGVPIYERQVRIPPTIHKGDLIAIAYEKPGLSLVTGGKALKDGTIGEKIQVLSLNSKKIIIGKITSHSRVAVN